MNITERIAELNKRDMQENFELKSLNAIQDIVPLMTNKLENVDNVLLFAGKLVALTSVLGSYVHNLGITTEQIEKAADKYQADQFLDETLDLLDLVTDESAELKTFLDHLRGTIFVSK